MKRLVLVVVAIVVSGTVVASQPVTLTDGVWADGVFDRAAAAQEMRQLQQWLVSEQVAAGVAEPLRVTVTSEEMAALVDSRCESCSQVATSASSANRVRIGISKPLAAVIDFTALGHGAVDVTKDRGLVWSAAVESSGATALRVHFTDVSLPPMAELYVYSSDGEAFGPYTDLGPLGDGEFWSHTVGGSRVVIQLRHFGSFDELAGARLTVADIGHIGPRFLLARLRDGSFDKAFCSFNEPCVENAACSQVTIPDAEYAIAHMQFVDGRWLYYCTGGLLADTLGSQTPYFLTANHCLSKSRTASTLEAYFQYTTTCNGPCYDPVGAVPRTLGASVLSTNKTGDYTLLELGEPAPGGSFFLGWNTEAVAYTHDYNLFRLSHPGGAPQAYSEHSVDAQTSVICSSWPRGGWIYSHDSYGATEGGSSGSPVLNSSGEVVGQLSGACGYDPGDPCAADLNSTVDGAFASYYPSVAQWLAPGGGCVDADDDGYADEACGGTDCDDGNPLVNPGMAEDCADGIDNDCDGFVDGADDECGGTCLPKGDPCTSGDQCCSGQCHPRKLTCK